MNWSITTKSPGQIFAQAADGRQGDDIGDPAALQRIDIRPVIDLRRRQHVAAAVARNKHNRPAVQRSKTEFVRCRAEGAFDPPPFDIGKSVYLIEPAPSDDADDGPGHSPA